jgi:Arc/MetJ-type ribon-helix-helix transcriptional regulator
MTWGLFWLEAGCEFQYPYYDSVIQTTSIQTVEVSMRAGTMIPITVTLPPGMTEEIDSLCKKSERSRSELVREALRAYIGKRDAVAAPTPRKYSNAYLKEAALDFETHADFAIARADALEFEQATVADGLADFE